VKTCACPAVEHRLPLAALAVKRRDCRSFSFYIFTEVSQAPCKEANDRILCPNLPQRNKFKA